MGTRHLADFLELSVEEIPLEPSSQYEMAGLYSFGRGLFERDPVRGSDTSYAKFNRLREGQLVISRLKAFEGAVTVVPPEFDGRHLSREFPTYDIDPTQADPRFVRHLCRWPGFWDLLREASYGVGARRERVHKTEILTTVSVPLPDFAEQRRLAEVLDAAQTHVSSAKSSVERSRALASALVTSLTHRGDLSEDERLRRGWRLVPVGEFVDLDLDEVRVSDDGTYPMVGVFSFGRGLFAKDSVSGSDTSYTKYYRLHPGQIVLSRLFGWEGAIALVTDEFEGRFVSTEFPTFRVDENKAVSEFSAALFATEAFWGQLRSEAEGMGVRRQRIHAERFMNQEVWLPPLPYQYATTTQIAELREIATEERRDELLDAVMPSLLNATFSAVPLSQQTVQHIEERELRDHD